MNITLKRCIRAALFIIIALILSGMVFTVLWVPYGDGSYRDFYSERKDTANVVLIGTSNIKRDWISLEAWKETGYNYYALCSSGQPMPLIKYLMIEAQKTQSPDLFVIDMRSMSLPGKSRVSAGDIRKVTDNMKFSLNRINAIDAALDYAGIKTSNGNRDYYFSFMYYHSMWKHMSAANLRTASTLKGYSLDHLQKVSLSVADQKMGWYHSPTGTLPAENVRCLNDLLAYIRQNNLNVLFLIPPMHFSAADSARLAAAVQLIKSRGCKIYDANDHYAGMGIDFTTDYRNPHHMNQRGAVKFTSVFAKYLTEHYSFTKHNDAKQKAAWAKAYARYKTYYSSN